MGFIESSVKKLYSFMNKGKAGLEDWQTIITGEELLHVPFFCLCFPTLHCGRGKNRVTSAQLKATKIIVRPGKSQKRPLLKLGDIFIFNQSDSWLNHNESISQYILCNRSSAITSKDPQSSLVSPFPMKSVLQSEIIIWGERCFIIVFYCWQNKLPQV